MVREALTGGPGGGTLGVSNRCCPLSRPAGGKPNIAGLVPAIFLEVENRENMAFRNALRVVNRVATEKSPSGTAITGAHAPFMCLEAQK